MYQPGIIHTRTPEEKQDIWGICSFGCMNTKDSSLCILNPQKALLAIICSQAMASRHSILRLDS